MLIKITKDELMSILKAYFTDEVESCPLHAEAFCDILFCKYEVKDLPGSEIDQMTQDILEKANSDLEELNDRSK